MNFKIIFSHIAIIDLEKIVSFYYDLNKSTAKRYYNGIIKLSKKLKDFPEMGRIVIETEDIFYDKYRELIFENYRIIYKIEYSEIIIIRVLDGRMSIDASLIELI